MYWEVFERDAPELAQQARAFFDRKVALIGTLRQDGSPRIDPIEPYIGEGHLLLAMMWQSHKAANLLRDPRCTLHNPVSDPDGTDGEFKLYGRAMVVNHAALRTRYLQTFGERWQDHPFHLFMLDIEGATSVEWDAANGEMSVVAWRPETGIRQIKRKYP